MRALAFALGAFLAAAQADAEPFLPSDGRAVDLVLARRTDGFATIGQTLAYAERASRGAFVADGFRVARRDQEPFVRVQVCYRLGDEPPTCGLDYAVTVDPPHVEPTDRLDGLARDLEHGPKAFLVALAREDALRRQPVLLQRLRAVLGPIDPYDWR